jgi:hypothetical protein
MMLGQTAEMRGGFHRNPTHRLKGMHFPQHISAAETCGGGCQIPDWLTIMGVNFTPSHVEGVKATPASATSAP